MKVIGVRPPYTAGTTSPLPGAKFTLTEVDEQGHDITGGYFSGQITVDQRTGEINFTGLKPGKYRLNETHIPDGYIKSEGPYYIIINRDGSSAVDMNLTVSHTLISKDDTSGAFTVENEPGAALPNTGGPGNKMIYLLGIMLTSFAGVGLLMRRRKNML